MTVVDDFVLELGAVKIIHSSTSNFFLQVSTIN